MINILIGKGVSLSSLQLPKEFMSTINELMSRCTSSSLDSSSTKDLIMIYLDLLESLPPTTFIEDSPLGRETLISPNFTIWLSSCGPNYLLRSLRVLNKLTGWIVTSQQNSPFFMMSPSPERTDLARRITERTMGFLQQSVALSSNSRLTDLEPLAFLAADLTLLSRTLGTNSSDGSSHYNKYFDHFALSEWTVPEVSQYFVARLVSYHKTDEDEDSSSENLLVFSSCSELKWVQVWIRLISLDASIPDELSGKVLGNIGYKSTNNQELLRKFINVRSEDADWNHRNEIGIVLQPLLTLLRVVGGGGSGSAFAGGTVGCIVKTAVTTLKEFGFKRVYTKGDSSSVGHKVLEILVPPLMGTFPWEKLPQMVLKALKPLLYDVSF
jgi:hypothetical protein